MTTNDFSNYSAGRVRYSQMKEAQVDYLVFRDKRHFFLRAMLRRTISKNYSLLLHKCLNCPQRNRDW